MVTIDQYNSRERASSLAGVLRFLSFDIVRPVVFATKFVLGRTDADLQRRRIRIAERISEQAARPTVQPLAEPARLTTLMMAEYLQPCAAESLSYAENAIATTEDLETSLDRIDYELARIRSEIAQYMP